MGSQRFFEMSLRIRNIELVRSRAASKKEATLLAAQDLLKKSEGKIESIEGLLKEKGYKYDNSKDKKVQSKGRGISV